MSIPLDPPSNSLAICEQKARQRVTLACLNCRKKRIKCDGGLPECSTCNTQGLACEYQFSKNKRKPPSKTYVRSLEGRIQFLEQQLAAKNGGGPSNQYGVSENDGSTEMQFLDKANDKEGTILSDVTSLFGSLNVGDDGQMHYFGSQSNYHLLQSCAGDTGIDTQTQPAVSMQREGIAAVERLGKGMPLSMELQENLLQLFWTWHNPWNYIVHKKAFMAAFESRTYGKYCTPLLLSAIFALGSRYSDRPEVRTDPDDQGSAGYAFFEKAKIMLLYESQAPTVATVQAAALMGIRAMSDNEEALGWLYCGNAARMAFNIGLNLDCSQWVASGLIPIEEAEVRKVTWWGVYSLDKLFSIALGRPGCTSQAFNTCPKPSFDDDAEYEPWNPELPRGMDSSEKTILSRKVSTGHSSIQCLTIASEAMQKIYAPNSALSRNEITDIVAKADVELRAYYVDLPGHLRLPASSQVSAPAHIYQLHMQYHVNLILLHRPLFPKYETFIKPSPSLWEDPHMVCCRESASQVVRLLRVYKHHYTMRHAAIVTVHIAFTAAVVLLIDAKDEENPHRQQAIRGLEVCMGGLEDMKSTWCAWSSKALQAVKNLAVQWAIDLL